MEIDKYGYTLSELNDILKNYETELQKKFGSDFYIKPEGLVDNIITASGLCEMDLQDKLASLCKQFDALTAEDEYQDVLYERVGLERIDDTPTEFTIKVFGIPDFSGEAGSITLRSSVTSDEFVNVEDYVLDESGCSDIKFQAVVTGAVEVNSGDEFQIALAPEEIFAVISAFDITIGSQRETDSKFRERFNDSKAVNARAARNANLTNLSKYVDNMAFLKIIDKRTDKSFKAGSIEIIVKHNTTDEIFAKAVLDSVADGLDFIGNTTVTIKDNSGEDVEIKFEKALEPEICIKGTLKLKQGFYPNNVMTKAKQSVEEYITERVFGLGSIIYATEFIVPILEADGVEAVLDIAVKKDDGEYTDSVTLARNEAPKFQEIVLLEGDEGLSE